MPSLARVEAATPRCRRCLSRCTYSHAKNKWMCGVQCHRTGRYRFNGKSGIQERNERLGIPEPGK